MLRNTRAAASAIIITARLLERGYATVRRMSVCQPVCDFQVL